MKRILSCLLLMLVFSAKSYSADYYLVGVDAFKKGCYDKAASNLEHAIRVNPKNVNARYYLAQAYLMQNRVSDATDQYNRIILLDATSSAGILSQKGLSLIAQATSKTTAIASASELDKYKDNYLDYVLTGDGDIRKWASFPVSVYVEPNKHKDAALRAFNQWQDKSKKLVNFTYVNSPEKAKITVRFKDKLESTSTKDSFIAGYSKPEYEGIHLSKSEISLLTTDPESKTELDDNFIFATTLHELGHSLGFVGHSPNSNDVMSASSETPKLELTTRDLNTLNVFYRIDQKTFLARKTGQTDLKLQQALDYIKKFPEKSIGWSNLGDIYSNKKMYSEAINSYKKAIAIEPDKANLHGLLATSYRLSGDKQNAFLSIKKACDLDTSNTDYLALLVQSASEVGQRPVAKSYVEAYMKSHPQSANDAKIIQLLRACN